MDTLIKKLKIDKKCKKCKFKCNAIYFQQNFKNWTSGNKYIDKFIQDTQLSAHYNTKEALEWIPYDRFYDIKYIEKKKMYRANWIDGYIYEWDDENQNGRRNGENMSVGLVDLKNSNNSKNIELELTNKVI
ncbi:hypothetical protein RirG_259550 [Rhizophagus irregularis DAOM 197198w]|uniref:Uncharacterized protein n=1 Tax=Rhizophagus irregularis (strain DAOM 197198w) TaxID=1432141 RepID=A0A015LA78_RHIIW|nr:hypothetical protein RirG_259550 [Rhizophagus irregularis DAOM 197198w]